MQRDSILAVLIEEMHTVMQNEHVLKQMNDQLAEEVQETVDTMVSYPDWVDSAVVLLALKGQLGMSETASQNVLVIRATACVSTMCRMATSDYIVIHYMLLCIL